MSADLLIVRRASINDDAQAMQQALDLARQAGEQGEVPVGAVVIYRQQLIGWGRNQPIAQHDPSAHAEMLALRMAASHLQNYRLPECTLFVTLEPCLMCFGAITQARLKRVVYATPDPKTGVCGSILALQDDARINHHTQVEGGLMAEASSHMLKAFFAARRKT